MTMLRFSLRPVVLLISIFLLCFSVSPAQSGESTKQPDSFSLDLHIGSGDGEILSGPLGLGDDLLVSARVPQLGEPGGAVLANIIWQLYSASGDPLPEFNKTRQVIGLGNQEFCSFRVHASGLANGTYFIGLTHQLASDPTSFYQASDSFVINQPLAIKQVVIDESPKGKVHQRIFYEDQSPHIFVYYYLADDVYTALVQIDVVDEAGKLRASRTLFKDKDFSRKRERVGIKLPPGLFKAGEKALVQVSVSTSDDVTVTAMSGFEILAIDLGIHLPDRMVQGTVTDFQLFVPQTFNGPYSLEFIHDDGFIFKHEEGGLIGKLFVTPAAEVGSHKVGVTVVDQLGNRASGQAVLDVEQGSIRSYQPPRTTSNSRKQGGRIGSSTRK